MSERLSRLMPNYQKTAKCSCEDANNNADRGTIGPDPGNSGDHDDDQPNGHHTDFIHGPKDSTTKALPHVVTALIAKRAADAAAPGGPPSRTMTTGGACQWSVSRETAR